MVAGEQIKYDTPLIRNLYDSLNVKQPTALSLEGIRYIVKKVIKLSGVRDNFEFKGQVKMSRGFRKFYKSEADLSSLRPKILRFCRTMKRLSTELQLMTSIV